MTKSGALLVAAGLGAAVEHALISPLAINGLRIFQALGADIDQLGIGRGHRTETARRVDRPGGARRQRMVTNLPLFGS